jgi:hypothetical protein
MARSYCPVKVTAAIGVSMTAASTWCGRTVRDRPLIVPDRPMILSGAVEHREQQLDRHEQRHRRPASQRPAHRVGTAHRDVGRKACARARQQRGPRQGTNSAPGPVPSQNVERRDQLQPVDADRERAGHPPGLTVLRRESGHVSKRDGPGHQSQPTDEHAGQDQQQRVGTA